MADTPERFRTIDVAAFARRQRQQMSQDRTALTWWYPKIKDAGLPVPKTFTMWMPTEAQAAIWANFDGKDGTATQESELKAFCDQIARCADELGWPAFLRTHQMSGKHQFAKCCVLNSPDNVLGRVINTAMHSELYSLRHSPWHTWAVREFLPIMPVGVCPDYDGMPICREFRCFVSNCHMMCVHPYWPRHALERGGAKLSEDTHRHLDTLNAAEHTELVALAMGAGWACGGSWSVDILETRRGWIITDMAEAKHSWHEWPECPNYMDLVWP